MHKKIIFALFVLFIIVFASKQVRAEDKILFDSTDNYLGGCRMTSKSEWELTKDIHVSKFQIWYKWNAGETKLPVKVFLNGDTFAEFDTTRSACDPYQQTWCNGDYQIDKLFPKGKYTTEVADSRQCLKPNGTGTIRLYGDDSSSNKSAQASSTVPVEPTTIKATQPPACSCNQTVVIITATITSVISAAIVALVLKR